MAPGFTVLPLRITIDLDLPLSDELASNPAFVQQWVADHLAWSVSLGAGVRAFTVAARDGGIVRKGG
jgi:hypothetical protein